MENIILVPGFSLLRACIALFLAWGSTLVVKEILEIKAYKKFKWSYFAREGGMPSSHSAWVFSMLMIIFLHTGFSLLTFFAGCMTAVILNDTVHIRYQVGQHKLILEKIAKKESNKYKLKREGHTIPQVLIGSLLGIIITTLFLLLTKNIIFFI